MKVDICGFVLLVALPLSLKCICTYTRDEKNHMTDM